MVYVMLADGFEEIEALAFTDILRRADIETKTVSTDNKGNNTGSHKITVITDCNIEQIDYDTIEAIVLPGGLPGAYNLRDNNHVVDILKFAISKKIPVGAICASPYVVLEENNLIDGLNATVNPYFYNDMKNSKLNKQRVVADNNIITSQGPGTTHEFAKEFVKILKPDFDIDGLISEMLYK
jgi:4-methyl-5(b-hydroxyethyl)-thiazole monophosphate biosynthesis